MAKGCSTANKLQPPSSPPPKKKKQNYGQGLVDCKLVEFPPPPPPEYLHCWPPPLPPSNCIAGRFGSLVILDVACCYLWLFSSKKGKKKLLTVRLAVFHLCGKLLFTWLSLVVSMMVSFWPALLPTRISWIGS